MQENACPYLKGVRRVQWIVLGTLMGIVVMSLWFPLPDWVTPAAVLLCLLGAACALHHTAMIPMRNCHNDQLEHQYASDILCRQAEMDALQSQINPHFLYNTLDSIRGQALAEGAEDIAEMTEALSTFFRYSVSNQNHIATLEEELENVRNYFTIQQFRFNNRFQLQILPFSGELLTACRLPRLTLQPILENAILHGMEQVIGCAAITIRVEDTALRTVITISDNGSGMSEETLLRLQSRLREEEQAQLPRTRGSGIALPNVNRRIKLLFGEEYGLRVMSTLGQGTDVEICLPPSGGGGHEA